MTVETIEIIQERKSETSIIPIIFYVIALLILIIGLWGGYRLGETEYSFLTGDRNWTIVTPIWIVSLISSMTFVGFGKVIELLLMIYNKE